MARVMLDSGPSSGARRRATSKPLNVARASYSTPRRVTTKPFNPAPQRNVVNKPFNPAPAPVYRATPSPNRVDRATPVYRAPAPVYAPAPQQQAYRAPAPVYQPAQINSYSPPAQQQAFRASPTAQNMPYQVPTPSLPPATFAEPIEPPKPPRKIYNKDSWLAGDSDYKEQVTEYDRAINSFRNRINAKKAEFDEDYKQAEGTTQKNRDFTLNDLGEDFGSRGLAYSGLFDQAKERTNDQFRQQIANLVNLKQRQTTDADEEFADFGTETNLRKANALRQAIARMAQAQALSDSRLGY